MTLYRHDLDNQPAGTRPSQEERAWRHGQAPSANGTHLRISDAEREQAVAWLRDHAAAGRLTLDELDQRVARAFAARTSGELSELFADLPASRLSYAEKTNAKAAGARAHVATYLAVSFMLIAIWASTGAGYFWPMWPMLGWGIGVSSHTASCFGSKRRRSRQ